MSTSVPGPGPDAERIMRAADVVARHRLEREGSLHWPSGIAPRDEAEGYAVQHAVHARLTDLGPVAGRKIGCTHPVMQQYLGIDHPCSGGVLEGTTHEGEGHVRHADYVRPGVECEIAVRLGRDLPPGRRPYHRDDVLPAVDAIMPAIEIVDDRFGDWTRVGTPSLIATDFFGAGCVLGDAVLPSGLDLAGVGGELRINGAGVGKGFGRDLLGDPLEALAWLASHRSASPDGLPAGSFVLLGSIVEVQWVEPDTVVEVSFPALGDARAIFS